MKLKKSFKTLQINLRKGFRRFPISILNILLITVLLWIMISNHFPSRAFEERLLLLLFVTLPISLSLEVFVERFNKKMLWWHKLMLYAGEAIFAICYYVFIIRDISDLLLYRNSILMVVLWLTFLVSPYIYKRQNIEFYISKLFINFVTSVFYSGILTAGLMIVWFTIKGLLYPGLQDDIFSQTLVFGMVLFNGVFFISNIPKVTKGFTKDSFNKILKVALLYIVMPILAIYTLVLYVYFGKIVINWQWPEEAVSWLVLVYASVTLIALFFTEKYQSKLKWVRHYHRIIKIAIYPLLAILFAAIFVRINDYGITLNRYYVVLGGVWTVVVITYYNLRWNYKPMFTICTLAVLLFISAFGPLSAINVSARSQVNRLTTILNDYDAIEGNKIVRGRLEGIDVKDQREIYKTLDYVDEIEETNRINYIPDDFKMKDFKDVFGFNLQSIRDAEVKNEAFYFHYTPSETNYLGVKSYEHFIMNLEYDIPLSEYDVPTSENEKTNKTLKFEDFSIVFSKEKIMVKKDGTEIDHLKYDEFLNQLVEKHGDRYHINKEDMQDFVVKHEHDGHTFMYVFKSLAGRVDEAKSIKLTDVKLDLFIK